MTRIIPRPAHAVLDYLYSIAVLAAPEALDLDYSAEGDKARLVCKTHGVATIAASLLTRYELGLIKLIPFNMHLLLDLSGAVFGLASPWLLGFSGNKKARNVVLAFALLEAAVVALSQRDEAGV